MPFEYRKQCMYKYIIIKYATSVNKLLFRDVGKNEYLTFIQASGILR